MFQKLRTSLKRPVHPYGLLASSLTILILVTALSGMWHYQYELAHRSEPPTTIALKGAVEGVSTQSPDGASPATPQNATNGTVSAPTKPQQRAATSAPGKNQVAPTSNSTTSPTTIPNPAAANVSLSVNGNPKGSVTLSSSNNQCDVLSAALKVGIISNLDMRYNAQYKTYAVYAINNIGDSGTIWWTYTVNGKSPPYGCSGTTVHNNDSVNWQYIKR